jgi:hypothetical protein
MNKTGIQDQVRVIASLVEGNSINSTVRMTGIAKTTILRLIAALGEACQRLHDEKVVKLTCKRVQCDELWAFCYAKAKNVPADKKGQFGYGDCWTWTAIDADTKLMVSWMVGNRDGTNANAFMGDVAGRLANRVQLTSDAHHTYLNAVANQFDCNVDYAQLIKIYGEQHLGAGRYSPPVCVGVKLGRCIGDPDQSTFQLASLSGRI